MYNEKGFIAYYNVFLMIFLIASLKMINLTSTNKALINNAQYFRIVDYVTMEHYRSVGTYNIVVLYTTLIEMDDVRCRNISYLYHIDDDDDSLFLLEFSSFPGYHDGMYSFYTSFSFDNKYLVKILDDVKFTIKYRE